MTVRVLHTIDDLADDLRTISRRIRPVMAQVVADNAREGRDQAKVYAKESARAHGKHYPNSITAERTGNLAWEYGPDSAMPQGGMSFEFGSRNQKPHLDLARSADVIHIQFGDDVSDALDDLFWPGA